MEVGKRSPARAGRGSGCRPAEGLLKQVLVEVLSKPLDMRIDNGRAAGAGAQQGEWSCFNGY